LIEESREVSKRDHNSCSTRAKRTLFSVKSTRSAHFITCHSACTHFTF